MLSLQVNKGTGAIPAGFISRFQLQFSRTSSIEWMMHLGTNGRETGILFFRSRLTLVSCDLRCVAVCCKYSRKKYANALLIGVTAARCHQSISWLSNTFVPWAYSADYASDEFITIKGHVLAKATRNAIVSLRRVSRCDLFALDPSRSMFSPNQVLATYG